MSSGASTWLWWFAAKIDRAILVEVGEPVEARALGVADDRCTSRRIGPSTISTRAVRAGSRRDPLGVVVAAVRPFSGSGSTPLGTAAARYGNPQLVLLVRLDHQRRGSHRIGRSALT